MSKISGNQPVQHLKYLDSARGIAALMVFALHFMAYTFPFKDVKNASKLNIFFNGVDAVSFFFVLSGFVLSFQYLNGNKPLDIKKFYVSRIFRLFPPYFIILVLSELWTFKDQMSLQTLSKLFVFNLNRFWEEAFLLRPHNVIFPPGWTLNFELICSFLIPFYIALALKNKKYIPFLAVVLLLIGNSISFSFHFLLGMLIAHNYARISDASFKKTRWYKFRVPLLLLACLFFSLRHINDISNMPLTIKYLMDYFSIDFFTLSGLASAVFIAAMVHFKKVQAVLQGSILVFLGRISYAVYLVHELVMKFIVTVLGEQLGGPLRPRHYVVFTIICVAAVIITATVFYYLIELPFIRLGKRIVAKMKPSLIVQRD